MIIRPIENRGGVKCRIFGKNKVYLCQTMAPKK